MNKVAFLTTVFPENEEFLKSFFNSLSTQTYKNFDLVIVNDNFKNLDFYKELYSNLNFIIVNSSNTPAKNREAGINYCIDQNYEALVFGDSDDYFKDNRIEKLLKFLIKADVVVNDLSLFDDNGIYEKNYLSNRVKNLDVIDFEFIKDKNIFGMTNTAIRLKGIERVSFSEEIISVDWYFFKRMLRKGCKAIFTNETESFYRQHKNNTAGLSVKNNKYYLWWETK